LDRERSHNATHLVVVVVVLNVVVVLVVVGAGRTSSKNPSQGSFVSNRIQMKFVTIVLQVNTHRLKNDGVGFLLAGHFQMAVMTSLQQRVTVFSS